MTSGFNRLWVASTVSNIGDGMRLTALPLLAASLTREPGPVAAVTLVGTLPWLVLSPLSGALIDRLDRRRLIVTVNLWRAAAMVGLALMVAADRASMLILYLVAFALGVGETLADNAGQVIVPELVSMEDLERANGRLFATEIIGNGFVGPPVGAALFAVAAAAPFAIDAASFSLAAALVATIALPRRAVEARPLRELPKEVAEGIRWLWQHRFLRHLAITLGLLNLFSAAAMSVLVLFALEILDLDETGFGILAAVSAVGGLAGALGSGRLRRHVPPGPLVVTAGVALGVSQFGIGLSSSAVVVGGLTVVAGFLGVNWNVVTVSLRQATIPTELLGRVNSAYRMIGTGSMPAGAAVGGLLAESFGLRAPFLVGGVAITAAALSLVGRARRGEFEARRVQGAPASPS